MVISGGHFKPEALKPKEVVSLLLDDAELECKCKFVNKNHVKTHAYNWVFHSSSLFQNESSYKTFHVLTLQNATREWPIYFILAELCFVVGRVISYQFLEMLMKLLNCVRLFRNFPKQYVHSQFWLKHVLHERTMKEIVLSNVYLLGEKGWSDGWIGAICSGGKM